VRERKLVVNEAEAARVRRVFELFAEGAVAGVVGNPGGVVSGLCSKPEPALARRRRPRHGQG
jgi:hypothetical protein